MFLPYFAFLSSHYIHQWKIFKQQTLQLIFLKFCFFRFIGFFQVLHFLNIVIFLKIIFPNFLELASQLSNIQKNRFCMILPELYRISILMQFCPLCLPYLSLGQPESLSSIKKQPDWTLSPPIRLKMRLIFLEILRNLYDGGENKNVVIS